MPYLETAHSWLTQSTLLLTARPSTTRITTKYSIRPPTDTSAASQSKQCRTKSTIGSESNPLTTLSAAEPIRATLTLKTYDPASGTTLKYSTTKAAEVSRLVQIMGRLARPMAGLPELTEDLADTTGIGEFASGITAPAGEASKAGGQPGQPGAGAKKAKKKGRK